MKRTLDNGRNNQQLERYSNDGNYIINDYMINDQQDNITTLKNTENFAHLLYELNKSPEYVYKSILDYGLIDNNSQYTATLDYLLKEFNGKESIYHMINWSLEGKNIKTSNYILNKTLNAEEIKGDFLNAVSSTGFKEVLINALTHYFSSKKCLYYEIGYTGAQVLAEILKTNTSLTKLELSENKIGDNGSKEFAEVLKVNTALTSLHIVNNKISDEGVIVMVEALKVNASLTGLFIYNIYHKKGYEVYVPILEALKSNFSLTQLFIEFNQKVNNLFEQDIDKFTNQNKYYAKTLATFLRDNQVELNKACDGDINKLKEDDAVSPPIGVYSYFTILFKVSISNLKNVIDLKEKFDISKYKEFMAANFFTTVCKSFGNQIIDGKEEIHILKFLPKEVLCKIVYGLPFPSWKVDVTDSYNKPIINFDELVNNYLDELAMQPWTEFQSDMLGILGEDAE